MISIIGLFYPSLHSNPKNPPIKPFIFSLLASSYQKERERRSRPKEEHCLMLNLVLEKGASKDRDRSESSITPPRTGTPTGFVQRSRLDFGLGTSPYTLDMCFLFLLLYNSFEIIYVCISRSHPRLPFIHSIAIYFLIFPSYYLYFHLY